MILVLLPAYNEEKSLPPLFPKLRSVLTDIEGGYLIVVCDDGSTDQTGKLLEDYAKTMPIKILSHNINRGLGETMRDLFEYAAVHVQAGDVIIRMDCDDTHEPNIIAKMIKKLRQDCDVVIASRFEPGGGQHGLDGYRTAISRAANLFMRIFFPIKGVKEYSCGFRAYRAEAIQRAVNFYGNNFIQLKGLGFTCTLEKLIKLNILGMRFGEVPFELRYDQKVSESKMVSSVTTLGYLVMTLLYHWPWGGWRTRYARILADEQSKIVSR
jgi:dolichol-phosphate mannosyltransferase